MLTSTRLLQCCNVLDFMCASFWMLLKVLVMLASITLIHCFVFWFYMMFLLLHFCNLCFIGIYKLVWLLWCFGSYVCITLNIVESDRNVVVYAIIPWIALFFFFALCNICFVALLSYVLCKHCKLVILLWFFEFYVWITLNLIKGANNFGVLFHCSPCDDCIFYMHHIEHFLQMLNNIVILFCHFTFNFSFFVKEKNFFVKKPK